MEGGNRMQLNWKKKWLDDKSGYWYSAKIPVIGWEYIIDPYDDINDFRPGLYMSKNDSDAIKISKKTYKTKEAAMKACNIHLKNHLDKFIKLTKLN
jgi:hypothetical protein